MYFQVIFTSEQTYELMRCLEELRLSFRSAEYLGGSEKSTTDKDNNRVDAGWSTKVGLNVQITGIFLPRARQ